ncbi:ABC transporter ATP-binding protein [Phaeobacter sp. B1627]|nr:ABC transporter ATP-binding protein [Phaeobacter sp. B1627]
MTDYNSNDYPIRATGLAKRFGDVKAVSNVNLEVMPGSALGLLGPNGAGKSTTLSMLMGLCRPDAGDVLVFGNAAGSLKARQATGATPQATDFPDQLTPRELLRYTAACYGKTPKIDDLAEQFGLQTLIERRVAGFSGGELRRVALALAFASEPALVFLDEPTTGLDIDAQDGFREAARAYVAHGGALVLTSHNWDEIEAICDSISLIDQGETVLNTRIDDMRVRANIKHLSFDLPPGTVPPEWMQATHDGRRWHMDAEDADSSLRRMIADNLPFQNLSLEPLPLDVLIKHIRKEGFTQ